MFIQANATMQKRVFDRYKFVTLKTKSSTGKDCCILLHIRYILTVNRYFGRVRHEKKRVKKYNRISNKKL